MDKKTIGELKRGCGGIAKFDDINIYCGDNNQLCAVCKKELKELKIKRTGISIFDEVTPIIFQEKVKYEYYYNPNVTCNCGAIFADTHKSFCRRRRKINNPQQRILE